MLRQLREEVRDFRTIFPNLSMVIKWAGLGVIVGVLLGAAWQRTGYVVGYGEPVYYTRMIASPIYTCILVIPTDYGLEVGANDAAISCLPKGTQPIPPQERRDAEGE